MKIEEMSTLLSCYLYTVIYFSIFCHFLCKTVPDLFRKSLFFLALCFQSSLGPFGGIYHVVVKFLCLYVMFPSLNYNVQDTAKHMGNERQMPFRWVNRSTPNGL